MFQLFKGNLKAADAFGFKVFENDLIGTARFVDADAAETDNRQPVFGFEFKPGGLGAEDNCTDL